MNILFLFSLFILTNFVHSHPKPLVIIIGAGASGIAAASRLIENGIRNITILEAQNRIGGRIHSVKFGDAYVDLGAQWCHGEDGNLVYEMVKDLNLLQSSDTAQKMFYSSGKELSMDFMAKIFNIMDDIYEVETDSYSGEDITIGEFFATRYNSRIKEIFANDSMSLKQAEEALPLMELLICGLEGCFTFYEVSVKSSYKETDGDQTLNWNGEGYKVILDVLMKKFPNHNQDLHVEEKILFNRSVEEINWNPNSSNVVVTTQDGLQYLGDHVIFTPSLGVLKKKYQSMFKQKLPNIKEDVIKSLGFRSAMKVFLYFTNPWWSSDLDGITFLWSNEDRQEILQNKDQKFPWILGINYLISVQKNPNVLELWIGNKTVLDLEKSTNEEIIDGIDFFLNKFMGKTMNITKADRVLTSNWHSNENFLGIYSFQTVESHKIASCPPEVLQQPLLGKNEKPVVLFAGEATNTIHYSTVHGAIESGYREADRIVNYRNAN